MGINSFIYSLLFLAICFVFYKKDTVSIEKNDTQKPLLVFENSTMYDLSVDSIEHIITSKQAMSFKDYEQLNDAVIMSRVEKKKSDSKKIDNISAEKMIKYDKEILLSKNVEYNRFDGLQFTTEQLHYDIKRKIATANADFVVSKEKSSVRGDFLRYYSKEQKLIAQNTNFKLKFKEEDK